jgi:hypothetical protein
MLPRDWDVRESVLSRFKRRGREEIRFVLVRPEDKQKDPILPLIVGMEEIRAGYKRKNWILPAPLEM